MAATYTSVVEQPLDLTDNAGASDPHASCRHEVARLQRELDRMRHRLRVVGQLFLDEADRSEDRSEVRGAVPSTRRRFEQLPFG